MKRLMALGVIVFVVTMLMISTDMALAKQQQISIGIEFGQLDDSDPENRVWTKLHKSADPRLTVKQTAWLVWATVTDPVTLSPNTQTATYAGQWHGYGAKGFTFSPMDGEPAFFMAKWSDWSCEKGPTVTYNRRSGTSVTLENTTDETLYVYKLLDMESNYNEHLVNGKVLLPGESTSRHGQKGYLLISTDQEEPGAYQCAMVRWRNTLR